MLDDGIGFSLVPWKQVVEQRLGQQVAAIVRGSSVTWELAAAWTVGVGCFETPVLRLITPYRARRQGQQLEQ